jgi:hypothetical protein
VNPKDKIIELGEILLRQLEERMTDDTYGVTADSVYVMSKALKILKNVLSPWR